ncbi:hypothetical protein [Brevibacillus porteri]|uniref:hypothetical protein n=1 Tax=Brevibacillus porteri TaxID=2126350 RepID=UPI00363DDB85
MKKGLITLITFSLMLVGCAPTTTSSSPEATMNAQNQKKAEQAAKMMTQTDTPTFNRSLERENIAERLKQTNDPNMLQWIYPMSAGRVIGRFPVRGKITSGSKRLTSPVMKADIDKGEYYGEEFTEAPDEMGAYGSSGEYIFWFDPANRYHQHRGDYFLSPVPYKIDLGYGTISTEIDQTENSKRNTYEKQINTTKK